MAKHTCAMIGCGYVATYHLPAYQVSDKVEVVAASDINAERLKAVADRYGIKGRYTDTEKMLDEVKPEIAIIGLPCRLHRRFLEVCLDRGCHVLVEKPLAMNMEEIDEMILLAKKSGKKVMVDQNYRWTKISLAIKRLIDEGVIGEPYWIEFHQYMWNPNQIETTFLKTEDRVVFFEMGIHIVDMIRYWLGREATKVYAQMPKLVHFPSIGDSLANVSISFGEEKIASIVDNWGSKCGPLSVGLQGRVDGKEGCITFGDGNTMRVYSEKSGGEVEPGDLDETEPGGFMNRMMNHFVECIEQDKLPMSNPEDNKKSMAIVFAAYESAKIGDVVSLSL